MDPGAPRIAVAPAGVREHLRTAVLEGGGELVGLEHAEAVVWTEVARPDELANVLTQRPDIRWVQLPWSGIEPYVEAGVVDDRRIWTSAKGLFAAPVAEHALALLLSAFRGVGGFQRVGTGYDGALRTLQGARVTIYGGGGIAMEFLRILSPFSCHTTVVRRRNRHVPGADCIVPVADHHRALKGADAVVLALALTAETERIIGVPELQVMPSHAWLVNVARGRNVHTGALVSALRDGGIGGAALDVTDPEPLPADHPLLVMDRAIVTPHKACPKDISRRLQYQRVRDNTRRFAAGEPLDGVIDADAGY